jgi:alkylated DNA repair dioxygenase AlkB
MLQDTQRSWQGCLFGGDDPAFDATFGGVERRWLDDSCWIDYAPNWLGGADALFAELADSLPWRQREVTMYERRLPEPRLTCWWDGSDPAITPPALLTDVRTAMTQRYRRPFDTIGFNLYRDGHDSVAWHGDRERFRDEDPVVVIVSLGSARQFMLRPRGGGRSTTFRAGHGDLLVMGGACQRRWEHCVPKTARAEGPRLSVMFRHNLSLSATA